MKFNNNNYAGFNGLDVPSSRINVDLHCSLNVESRL